MKNNTIKDVYELIANAEKPVFICHENPDSDTYGAAFGLRSGMKREDCPIVCASSLEWPFNELNFDGTIHSIEDVETDLYVYLDCADELRCGESIASKIKAGITTVSIDHHQSNTYYADYNYVIERSSTCELIFDILMQYNDELSKKTADYLYTGIAGDTGLFVHGYTSAQTHYTAGKLMEFGAEFDRISKLLFRTVSMSAAMLTGKLYNNLEIFEDEIAVSYVTLQDFKDTNSRYEDSEGLMSHLTNIDKMQICILLKQVDKFTFKASLRSTKEYDISKLAIANGGGGHKQAAGCKFIGNIDDIKKEVIKQIHDLGIA